MRLIIHQSGQKRTLIKYYTMQIRQIAKSLYSSPKIWSNMLQMTVSLSSPFTASWMKKWRVSRAVTGPGTSLKLRRENGSSETGTQTWRSETRSTSGRTSSRMGWATDKTMESGLLLVSLKLLLNYFSILYFFDISYLSALKLSLTKSQMQLWLNWWRLVSSVQFSDSFGII